MARDRANINTGIWNDADHRSLSLEAQHLYYLLMTHPTLTYVGVADWRPARLTPYAANLTLEGIEQAAAELVDGHYIIIDEDTEEVLVRSFVKHDGVLKHPKLKVSMAKAYTATASNLLRGIIVHELLKQRDEHPEYPCWGDKRVADVLTQPSVNPKRLAPPKDEPSLGVSHEVSQTPSLEVSPSQALPTSTATATSSNEERDPPPTEATPTPKRKHQLPNTWAPNEAHIIKAREQRIDLQVETEKFISYCRANGKKYVDFDQAFHLWLNKDWVTKLPDQSTTPSFWR